MERHREKEYIESLIEDIKSYTTEIQETVKSINKQVKGIDSLLKVIEAQPLQNFRNQLYYFSLKYLNSATYFKHSD